jgi:hypothetical protein
MFMWKTLQPSLIAKVIAGMLPEAKTAPQQTPPQSKSK